MMKWLANIDLSRVRVTWRRKLQVLVDLLLALGAWVLAYLIRFNFDLVAAEEYFVPTAVITFALLQVVVLGLVGVYSRLWRYTGLQDLRLMILGVALGALVVLALVAMSPRLFFAPRSTLLAQPVFFLMLIAGVRVMWRMARENSVQKQTLEYGEPVIVIGAGDAAAALLREFDRSHRWRAVALLDEHASRYPEGALSLERGGERVVALCKLGRVDAPTVRSYLSSHPNLPLTDRVQQACASILSRAK